MSYNYERTEIHTWSCDSCGAEFVSNGPPARLLRVTIHKAGMPAVELDLCLGCSHRPLFDFLENAVMRAGQVTPDAG